MASPSHRQTYLSALKKREFWDQGIRAAVMYAYMFPAVPESDKYFPNAFTAMMLEAGEYEETVLWLVHFFARVCRDRSQEQLLEWWRPILREHLQPTPLHLIAVGSTLHLSLNPTCDRMLEDVLDSLQEGGKPREFLVACRACSRAPIGSLPLPLVDPGLCDAGYRTTHAEYDFTPYCAAMKLKQCWPADEGGAEGPAGGDAPAPRGLHTYRSYTTSHMVDALFANFFATGSPSYLAATLPAVRLWDEFQGSVDMGAFFRGDEFGDTPPPSSIFPSTFVPFAQRDAAQQGRYLAARGAVMRWIHEGSQSDVASRLVLEALKAEEKKGREMSPSIVELATMMMRERSIDDYEVLLPLYVPSSETEAIGRQHAADEERTREVFGGGAPPAKRKS